MAPGIMSETRVTFPDISHLRQALAGIPVEMAEEVGDEAVREMERQPKQGKPFSNGFKRHSAAGEYPAVDSERLKNSKDVKRTGEFSAKVSFDTPYVEKLVKRKRKILPDEDVPRLEQRQKKKVQKVLGK